MACTLRSQQELSNTENKYVKESILTTAVGITATHSVGLDLYLGPASYVGLTRLPDTRLAPASYAGLTSLMRYLGISPILSQVKGKETNLVARSSEL